MVQGVGVQEEMAKTGSEDAVAKTLNPEPFNRARFARDTLS